MKNILLLNVGTRNKLVMYFKNELNHSADVIATDNYYLAPAIYEADRHYITERFDSKNYWDDIDEICDKENIGLIVSLIDPELEQLALHKEHFAEKGIIVNAGEYENIHGCYDKMNTLEFLRQNNFPYIKTYESLEDTLKALKDGEISFPLFMKPRCGSGSTGILKLENKEQLVNGCKGISNFIVQEFMNGQELGVDVFIDLLSGKVCSIFIKKKLNMRAGETDKSVSYRNNKLFTIINEFAEKYGLKGVNDIDVFEKNGEFYISEVNPRFGGGYLHAYECGENFPKMLINNMCNVKNKINIGSYKEGVYMMKYFDTKILEVK